VNGEMSGHPQGVSQLLARVDEAWGVAQIQRPNHFVGLGQPALPTLMKSTDDRGTMSN
jgi:hypothetical protein